VETAAVATVQAGIQELKLSSFQPGGQSMASEGAEAAAAAAAGGAAADAPLVWVSRPALRLPTGRCAHGAAVTTSTSTSTGAAAAGCVDTLCLFGGFTESGVSADVVAASLGTAAASGTHR